MTREKFFNLCEKTFDSNSKFLIENISKANERTPAAIRNKAGKLLLQDKDIFCNLKVEYIDEFLERFPTDWSLFSKLPNLTEEIIEKHINQLAIGVIFENFKDSLSQEFKDKYSYRLGLIKRIKLNIINIDNFMTDFNNATDKVKKKVIKLLETSDNDAMKLYVMLN